MLKMTMTVVAVLAVAAFVVPAQATVIGFETAEGYVADGDLAGQPSGGGTTWALAVAHPGDIAVVAGVGYSGAGLKATVGSTLYRGPTYSFSPTDGDLGITFNKASSAVDYSWRFRAGESNGVAGSSNRRFKFYVGIGGAVTLLEYRDDYTYLRFAHDSGTYTSIGMANNANWHQVNVSADWDAQTFTLFFDGVQQGGTYGFNDSNATPSDRPDPGVRLALYNGGSGAEGVAAYVDDVTITGVPEPATMSLLAVGGVLTLVRRKR